MSPGGPNRGNRGEPNTCGPMISLQVTQVFRGEPSRWYTVDQLAELWNVKRATVHSWRFRAVKGGHAPRPGQVRIHKLNRARRWVELRADYANLLEAIFIARTITL